MEADDDCRSSFFPQILLAAAAAETGVDSNAGFWIGRISER